MKKKVCIYWWRYDLICSFLTNDNIVKCISNMGNNSTPIAIDGENIYFLTAHFKFIKREKINYNELLETKDCSVDPFDYHVSDCENNSLRKLVCIKFSQIIINIHKPKPKELFGSSMLE